MYITYIIYSEKIKRFYSGQTEDIDRRIEEHNRGKTPFLARGIPWELVYSRQFDSRSEALKLEKYIKKRGAARFIQDLNTDGG